jgi:FixJ family two-component response regulator
MTTEHETPLIRAVDDDEDQLISLEALLSGEGWDVAAYTSARDFFVNDRPSRPGCLILDLRMPDVSGLEVQAEMKKRGITLPIIFLTGHGDIDTAVFAIRAGAEEFRSPCSRTGFSRQLPGRFRRTVTAASTLLMKLNGNPGSGV